MGQRAKQLILIVDEDEQTRAILKKRLGLHGFLCIGATTVEAGLEAMVALEPDLVILEVELPRGSGLRFLKLAKALLPTGRRSPPIIVVSCNDDQDIVQKVLHIGAAGFLAKPYNPKQLIHLIRSCMTIPTRNLVEESNSDH